MTATPWCREKVAVYYYFLLLHIIFFILLLFILLYYIIIFYCISLSVVGKLFGRVLIKRVRAGTECAIGEEQCGFRQGRGCIYQVFAVRQVCKKYLANGKRCILGFCGFGKDL